MQTCAQCDVAREAPWVNQLPDNNELLFFMYSALNKGNFKVWMNEFVYAITGLFCSVLKNISIQYK